MFDKNVILVLLSSYNFVAHVFRASAVVAVFVMIDASSNYSRHNKTGIWSMEKSSSALLDRSI